MADATAQLDQLAANLAELSTVPSRAARGAAERIDGLLREEFAASVDPYGNPWADLMASTVKRKGGDARILIRTGESQAETHARPTAGAGIQIVTTEQMVFHQTGTDNMTARPLLPGEDDGLPAEWEDAINAEVEAAFQKVKVA